MNRFKNILNAVVWLPTYPPSEYIARSLEKPTDPECIPQLQLRNDLYLNNNLQLLDIFCD